MKQQQKNDVPSKFEKGTALVVAISLIVLLSGLVLVLLGRALNQNNVASSEIAKRKMVSDWGEIAVVSSLIEEMVAGSDLIPIENADIDYVLKPADDYYHLPQVNLRNKQGENNYIRDFRFKNLIKQSQAGIPNFEFTETTGKSEASKVSSASHLTAVEWNEPFLIPREYETTMGIPDWVYIDEFGDFVQQNGVNRDVLGRYAYRVYDLGSLVNANISGYPNSANELDYSGKSSPVWIDMEVLPGFTPDLVNALSEWKYPALSKIWGKGELNENSTPILDELEGQWLSKTAGLYSYGGGNVFTGRQEMIEFFRNKNADPDALNFVTHYSYSGSTVNFFPDMRLPTVEFALADGGNDADQEKRKELKERFNTAPVLHRDKRGALMSQKFPLEKLALVANPEPNEALAPEKAAEIKRLFGLEWDNFENTWVYQDDEILSFDEYTEASRPEGFNGYWGPNFFQVLKAAINLGSLGRQMNNIGNFANFVGHPEIGTSIGSGGSAPTRNQHKFLNVTGRPSPRHTFLGEDGRVDDQIFRMGACLIDQWDENSYPTRIQLDEKGLVRNFYGIEDIPMLYGSCIQPYGVGFLPSNIGVPYGGSATAHRKSLWSSWFLQPMLWNMHAPKTLEGVEVSDGNYPQAFRVLANTEPIQIKMSGLTPQQMIAKGVSTLPSDYSPADPYFADLEDVIQGDSASNQIDFSDLSVRYSNVESDSDAFAYIEFTVNQNSLSNGSFRDPQLIRSDNYPEGSLITAFPDREDIPLNVAENIDWPFFLALSDARMTVNGAGLSATNLDESNEFDTIGLYNTNFFYHGGYPAQYSPLETAWVDASRWMREATTALPFENAFFDRNGNGQALPVEMRQSVVGFRLGTLPVRFNDLVDVGYGSNMKITCDFASLHLQYLHNNEWLEYDVMEGAITDDLVLLSDYEASLNLRADPRTNRWGTFPSRPLLGEFYTNRNHTTNIIVGGYTPYGRPFDVNIPVADAIEDLNTIPIYRYQHWAPNITGAGNQAHWSFGGSYSWKHPTLRPFFYTGLEALQWNDLTTVDSYHHITYRDPDGIQRRGVAGDLFENFDRFRLGQPLFDRDPTDPSSFKDQAVLRNNRSRPIILNRPFKSVAEMGYAFRDTAFKHIDFMMPESGDKALLDFFSIREAKNSPVSGHPIQAGLVELNTPHEEILVAILNGARKIEDIDNSQGSKQGELIQQRDALLLANLIFENGQDDNYGGYSSHADLISKYNGAGLEFNDFMSVSPDLAQGLGEVDGRLKRRFESVVRALTANTSTGTWNVMIDLVAQSGKMKPNGALSDFEANGQNRKWICLTIDRLTGKVLHRSEELVF